jgi:DNA-binding transcriptional regulator WhiA
MVNKLDSKSSVVRLVGSSPTSGTMNKKQTKSLAYIVGVALGDGNLSNSNGRAVRLRVTCDNKYPEIIREIVKHLKIILPDNKVGLIDRKTATDVYCYSNKLEELLGWKAKDGSKEKQKVTVPDWIVDNKMYTKECLRGLFQTDGSIYMDRKYLYTNFTSIIPTLINKVKIMIENLGFKPKMQKTLQFNNKTKYVIRMSREPQKFIEVINLWKK